MNIKTLKSIDLRILLNITKFKLKIRLNLFNYLPARIQENIEESTLEEVKDCELSKVKVSVDKGALE